MEQAWTEHISIVRPKLGRDHRLLGNDVKYLSGTIICCERVNAHYFLGEANHWGHMAGRRRRLNQTLRFHSIHACNSSITVWPSETSPAAFVQTSRWPRWYRVIVGLPLPRFRNDAAGIFFLSIPDPLVPVVARLEICH